ncbi:hypothetical protein BGZ83_003575 [Gryganskiella cystojenkinii]|nr:hypothetical protein BGZ83_003575 [Gryganskiella cystojenkinii]
MQRNYGQIATPEKAGTISENEDKAIAFCTRKLMDAPGAQIFPEGFIESAHFKENKEKNWVQGTDRTTPGIFSWRKKDGGDQYDIKAQIGAACANYRYFVNIVEPDGSIYCARCCAI